MEKKIFLPNAEQSRKLIENAWKDFCRQAQEAGYDIDDKTYNGFLKDCFAAGYAFGSNNMLGIIRDQMNADYMVSQMMTN